MKMEFKIVDVDDLVPNPFQPREGFDKESIGELADSFKSVGEIQPIIVRKHKKGYQIIAGERRWRAAKFARLKEIPVLIKDTAEENVLLESLIENLHRANLEPPEEENAVYELWETGKKIGRWKNFGELGNALGKSESWVKSHIEAKRIRDESLHAGPSIATRTILDVAGVEKRDRETILAKVEKGEIKTPEVREYARVAKKAPPRVKKAMFKPRARVTPRIAEKIIELPEKEHAHVIKEIEMGRPEEEEAISFIKARKIEVTPPPPEVSRALRERYQKVQERMAQILREPEVIKRGPLFKNWVAHISVAAVLDSLKCPVCGEKAENFGWMCHKLNVKKALEKAEKNYQESMEAKR